MTKLKKIGLLVCTVILGSMTAFCLSFYVTEKFFFDKVFYGKSILHGYDISGYSDKLEIYGRRSEGERLVSRFLANDSSKILGEQIETKANQEKPFLVAVIGDSYVWGAGIRNEQLFAVILEQKLNKIRPSKVILFGFSGDTLFDNYGKYSAMQKMGLTPDVVIFGLVDNDLLLHPADWLPQNSYSRFPDISDLIFHDCSGEIIRQNTFGSYSQDVFASFEQDTFNYCGFEKTMSLLPRENAIYFNFWDLSLYPDDSMQKFSTTLSEQGFHVISPLKEFQDYMTKKNSDDKSVFQISTIELHPSAIAHQLFSESLFQEIVTNPEYNFRVN